MWSYNIVDGRRLKLLQSPFQSTFKAKLFCNKCDTSSTDLGNDENVTKKFKKSNVSTENILSDVLCELNFNEIARSASDPNISTDKVESAVGSYLTSTPARFQQCACPDMSFTPQDQGQKSMSPITRSTQRMSRAMQETMMTPRSRKPVLVVSGTNINNLPKIETQDFNMDSVQEEITDTPLLPKSRSMGDLIVDTSSDEEDSDVLTDTFREYLHTRSTTNVTPTDLSFSSCTDDYYSTAINNSHLSSSLLHCLNGFTPPDEACNNSGSEKKLVLRPKQFDTNGKPIVYETSF